MQVVQSPEIKFTCSVCRAINKGEPEEFVPIKNTQPMLYRAKCGWCGCYTECAPTALIARQVARYLGY